MPDSLRVKRIRSRRDLKERAPTLSHWERVGPKVRGEGFHAKWRGGNPSPGCFAATLSRWERVSRRLFLEAALGERHEGFLPFGLSPCVILRRQPEPAMFSISIELYAAFVAAAAILIIIPGPNVALIVANSVAHGARYGLLTMAGTSSAMLIQLAIVVFGMSAMASTLAAWFDWLRWLGVAYLLYLGARSWRAPAIDLTKTDAQPRSLRAIYARGFFISLTNPKTLMFFGAFLPQFVIPDAEPLGQLILLAATFFAMATIFDAGWALAAHRFRQALAVNGVLRNRLSGGLLVGAGVGLAFARKS